MAEIVQQMTKGEAVDCVARIRDNVANVVELATRLRDEMGWKVLGYSSWNDCVEHEFDQSRNYFNRLIKAAAVVKKLGVVPMGTSEAAIPERVIRPLTSLPESEQPAAWSEAVESAGGKQPTAKQVKEVVEKRTRAEPGPLDGLLASVREAIEQGEAFRELMNAITQIKGKVKRLVDSPLGRHINPNELNANLTNAFRILKFAMPFADCVYCGRTIKKTCKACGGEGWLVQDVFNQAPPDMKANSVVRKVG